MFVYSNCAFIYSILWNYFLYFEKNYTAVIATGNDPAIASHKLLTIEHWLKNVE
jgi:hypothetical protein